MPAGSTALPTDPGEPPHLLVRSGEGRDGVVQRIEADGAAPSFEVFHYSPATRVLFLDPQGVPVLPGANTCVQNATRRVNIAAGIQVAQPPAYDPTDLGG